MKECDHIVDELMEREDKEDIMGYFLYRYAREVPGAAESLLSKIADIAKGEILRVERIADENWDGCFWAVQQMQMDKKQVNQYFSSMIPVVMTLFPHGSKSRASAASKVYWGEFVKLLRNKKVFDLEKESDWAWAEMCGYTEYLRMVLSQIEEEKHETE